VPALNMVTFQESAVGPFGKRTLRWGLRPQTPECPCCLIEVDQEEFSQTDGNGCYCKYHTKCLDLIKWRGVCNQCHIPFRATFIRKNKTTSIGY